MKNKLGIRIASLYLEMLKQSPTASAIRRAWMTLNSQRVDLSTVARWLRSDTSFDPMLGGDEHWRYYLVAGAWEYVTPQALFKVNDNLYPRKAQYPVHLLQPLFIAATEYDYSSQKYRYIAKGARYYVDSD